MGKENLSEGARVLRLMRRISEAGEQLTYEQALILSKRLADSYKRFLASGAWIGALEVRVGSRKILGAIQNRPDGLRELMYEYKCGNPADSVIQIWRSADREFDAVPLLFQELEDVTDEGVTRTEDFPNGQSLTLSVRKEKEGVFCVRISFEAKVDVIDDQVRRVAAAAAGKSTSALVYQRASQNSVSPNLWMQPSGFHYLWKSALATTLAMLLSIGSLFGVYVGATRVQTRAEQRADFDATASGRKPGAGGTDVVNVPAPRGDEAEPKGDDGSRLDVVQAAPDKPVWGGVLARVSVVYRQESPKKPDAPRSRPDAMVAVTNMEQGLTLQAKVTLNQSHTCSDGPRVVYVATLEESYLDERQRSGVRDEIIKSLKEHGVRVVEKRPENPATTTIIRLQFEFSGPVGAGAGLRADGSQTLPGPRPASYVLNDAHLDPALDKVSQQAGTLLASAIQEASDGADGQQAGVCRRPDNAGPQISDGEE